MTDELAFAPALPWTLIAAIGAAGLAVAIYFLIRAPRSGAFRLLAWAGLMALLLNPQIRVSERTPLDDIAVILVDDSASQSLDGRREVARAAAEEIESEFEALGGVEIARQEIGGEEQTLLGAALSAAIADLPRQRLGAVFVITDGQSADALSAPRAEDAPPIHFLLTGRPDETDRKVTLTNAPRYGIVNEGVDIAFRIDDIGPDGAPLTGASEATVSLRVDGEEVLRQAVPVGAPISFRAPLTRPGRTVIELEVEARDGELSERNNVAVLPISAIRDRLRVLLISGEPHAGERVWRNLLKSDPAIDLVHFTILRPIEKAGCDTALEHELALIEFPQDELFIEKLDEFDLVIFDRYTYRGVLSAYHFDNIARYVENGGAVLVSSGPEFNGYLSLAARRNFSFILPALPAGPAIETPFRPEITAEGRKHPVTASLPEEEYWGRWLRIMPAAQRSGATLMTGAENQPLLVLDRVGEGRVGLIQSDQFWLWARGFDGGGPHAELLRRISHWLMKEPDLEEEQLAIRDANGDLIVERRTIGESAGPVELTYPDGDVAEIVLQRRDEGRFEARIAGAPRGLYRARSGELFAIGAVGLAAPPEFENVVSDARAVSPVAEATGGGVFRLGSDGAPDIRRVGARATNLSGADWAGIVDRDAYRTEAVRDVPLAPPAVWLAIIAVALLGAWLIEGRTRRSPNGTRQFAAKA